MRLDSPGTQKTTRVYQQNEVQLISACGIAYLIPTGRTCFGVTKNQGTRAIFMSAYLLVFDIHCRSIGAKHHKLCHHFPTGPSAGWFFSRPKEARQQSHTNQPQQPPPTTTTIKNDDSWLLAAAHLEKFTALFRVFFGSEHHQHRSS